MKTIGIALGVERLVAALPGGRRLETGETADIRQAFADLKTQSGMAEARVSVALLPPLIAVRRVKLPPMRVEERHRVLERDAARHFVGVREPQTVATEGPLAAALPTHLLEELETAIDSAGWRLDAVVPAHAAWAACLADGKHAIPVPSAAEVLEVRRRRLTDRMLLRQSDCDVPTADIEPYVAAAEHVVGVRSLRLYSAARRARMRVAARRLATILLAAAAACLIVAAGLDHWGLNRELDVLRARRAAIAPRVAGAIRVRDSVISLGRTTRALDGLASTAPRWSGFFANLADNLPRDAYLAGFEARGDSVVLSGVARDAAGVLRGLEQMPALAGVHADGPIRQDVSAAGAVREHFRFSGRWEGTP